MPSAHLTEWRAEYELRAWEQQQAEQQARGRGGGW